MKKALLLNFVALLFIPFISFSQDRTFAWTYNSTVLSKGNKDLEGWSTFGTGRKYFYQGLDTRLELEVGLTDKIQTSLYFNASHKAFGANLDTLGGIADTSVTGVFGSSRFSISNEWKWKLSDPVVNKVGFTLYGEITLAAGWFELENKLIFDKKIGNNIFAMNLIDEWEFVSDVKKGLGETNLEALEAEVDLAYMHLFKPNCGLGFEIRNINEIKEMKNWENSALLGGPTYFHSGERYFIIVGLLPQWCNLKRTDDSPDNLVLNEHEKFSVRLLLGFGL